MIKTIKVTGIGELDIAPDTTEIHVSLTDVKKKYSEALADSASAVEALQEAFMKCGFAKEDLKTIRFNINEENDSYEDEKGRWRTRFAGYRYNTDCRLSFPASNETLGKCLSALAESPAKPRFSIRYTVGDPKKMTKALMKLAVKDAKAKAKVLAENAGVTLGNVVHISYTDSYNSIALSPVEEMCADGMYKAKIAGAPAIQMNVTPDNIHAKEYVTILFAIE